MDKDLTEQSKLSEKYQLKKFPLLYHKFLIEKYRLQEIFIMECLQKIYNSGRVQGNRLLDFGCGPSVYKLSSATHQFNDIILADISEPCRKEVGKWLRGDNDALDWTIPMEHCARAEGYKDLETGVAEIERKIRGAVKKVMWCDALAKDVLPAGIGEFDAITSSRCLEICCLTDESYKEALKKLTKHLKQGGSLVMITVLEGRSYILSETLPEKKEEVKKSLQLQLPVFCLTEELLEESLSEAGLELKDWFCWRASEKYDSFLSGGVIVHYSVKI